MAEENEQEEPSMDDVLSSIRDILSDDDESNNSAKPAEAAPATTPPSAEAPPATPPPSAEAPPATTPPSAEAAPATTPPPSAAAPVASEQQAISEEGATDAAMTENIVSSGLETDILELTQQMIAQSPPDIGAGETILSTGTSVHSTDALEELAKALLSKRDIAIGNRDMTMEGLVREILRPLLREWLDQNLPYLIERLVKKEIDHMVNRAERLDL